MKAPLCPVCQNPHWANQGHQWSGSPKPQEAPPAAKKAKPKGK